MNNFIILGGASGRQTIINFCPLFVACQQHICMKTWKNLETKPLQVKGIVAMATIFQISTFKLNCMLTASH